MNSRLFSIASAIFLLTAGCVSVEYSGKISPAVSHVDFYEKKADMKRDAVPVGNAHLSANYQEYSKEKMLDMIKQKARDVGASAVVITSYEIVPSGTVREDQALNDSPSKAWATDDDTKDGLRRMSQDFDYDYGSIGNKQMNPEVKTYNRVINAEFFRYSD
jgi:hypothetical protein